MILLRRLFAAFGVAFMVVLGTGTMATASESGGAIVADDEQPDLTPETAYAEADGASGNACGVGGGEAELNEAQNLLPVNRWSNIVTTFPRNPDAGITNLDVLVGETSTQMFGGLVFGLSSAMWSMNTAITSIAINFCPIDVIGYEIDSFLGTLGTVLLTGGAPLIAAVVAIVIIAVLWQMRRGTMAPLKQIAIKAAAIGALAVMTMGATQSTVGVDTDGTHPAQGQANHVWYSPGGLIVELNNAASGISSGSVEWIMDSMFEETGALVPQDERRGSAHCDWMIEAGHERFGNVVGPGAGLISGMSQTWVGTSYSAWTRALFGDEYSVSEGDRSRDIPHHYIPCRIAEWHADVPASLGDSLDQEATVHRSVSKNHYLADAFVLAGAMDEGPAGVGYPSTFSSSEGSSPAVYIRNLDNSMYWSLVAGMCHNPQFSGDSDTDPVERVDAMGSYTEANWEVSRVWHSAGNTGQRTLPDRLGGGSQEDAEDTDEFNDICQSFWAFQGAWEDNPIEDAGFQIHGSRGNIQDGFSGGESGAQPSGPGAVAMVNFMTSANVGGVTFEGIGSMMASVSVLILMIPVLIVLSLVRLMMVMMMIGLFLSLLMALLPNQNFEAFLKTLKMTIGIILLSIFVQVIFAVIMGIMLLLNDMGAEVLGTGGIVYAFWTAVTPWLAALGVHLTFKFLKLPSPLKMGAAMEWGNAMAKQGADSMGSKAGSMTGGGGAGEKSKGMADKLRKRKSGNDGSDSRGSGSDRQAGQEQTEARKGSQRGVLAKVGAGAAALGGKAKNQTGKELGGNEASAAARQEVKGVKDKFASVKKSKKDAQRQEVDQAKDAAWAKKKELAKQAKGHKKVINQLSGKENLNEDEQVALQQAQAGLADVNDAKKATAEGVKSLKKGHKDELGDLKDQRRAEKSDAKAPAKGARKEAIKANWGARKQALKGALVKGGSWANERRKALGFQGGQEGREQRRENVRAMGDALKSGAGAAGSGLASGARALPGATLRAVAGANKSEDLTTKQLAGRAARNTAVVGGLGAAAMAGGAPLAALGGAALMGGGALGTRRAWNTMTSKNEGSVRSRVGGAASAVKDSLGGAGRDPSVTDGGDGPTPPGPDGGGPAPDLGGGPHPEPPRGEESLDELEEAFGPTPPSDPGGTSTGGPTGPTPPTGPAGAGGPSTSSAADSGGSPSGPDTPGDAGGDSRTGSWDPASDGGSGESMPDFDESEGDSESSGGGFPSFGSLATGAIAGAAAAKHGVDKLGDAVEGFSPVDDQDTVDQQRRDKEFQEKLLGQSERIPGYNAPADEGDSREFSLDEKGGPPPMPPEREPRLFNDSPDAHHSGEDFAERMRRLRGNQ